jgi:hypothetical protein
MTSEAELEIQQRLSSYLAGKLQRYEFEDWLIPTLWDLAESDDDAARELAGHINNLIAETSCGDRSMESLQEELTRVARPFSDFQPKPFMISKPEEIELDFGITRKPPMAAVLRIGGFDERLLSVG